MVTVSLGSWVSEDHDAILVVEYHCVVVGNATDVLDELEVVLLGEGTRPQHASGILKLLKEGRESKHGHEYLSNGLVG